MVLRINKYVHNDRTIAYYLEGGKYSLPIDMLRPFESEEEARLVAYAAGYECISCVTITDLGSARAVV